MKKIFISMIVMLMLLITGCNTMNNDQNPVEEPQNDTPLDNNEPNINENDGSNVEER